MGELDKGKPGPVKELMVIESGVQAEFSAVIDWWILIKGKVRLARFSIAFLAN